MNTNLSEGDISPGFTLPADGDRTVSLSDLRGGPVVIYFYPRDDTPGCTREAIDFSSRIDRFDELKTHIIGISTDSVSKHDKFKAKHQLAVMLAADEDHAVASDYGVWVEKNLYGRKSMGIERATFLIDPHGRIAKIWRKVKVDGHIENVLEQIRDLT